MTTLTKSEGQRTWSLKNLRVRIKERVRPLFSTTLAEGLKSVSTRRSSRISVNSSAHASQLSLTSELPLPRRNSYHPPSYLEVSLLPLRRPASLNLSPVDEDELEIEAEDFVEPSTTIYTHPHDSSLEAALLASHESLPPFPGAVTEIVDLVRMAASLLYKEMQLVLISETQSGRFPASRADTWVRLGLLHRLINSWPSEGFSALDGIRSFKKSLNDGTILCEFVNHLSSGTPNSPYYGPDALAQVANIQHFISTYRSFRLPNSQENLLPGNPTFDGLGAEALASYARAIVSIHERFGKVPASFLQRAHPRTRSSQDSIVSLASRIRRSSAESQRSRRSSPYDYGQLSSESPPPNLAPISENAGLEQTADCAEAENDCMPAVNSIAAIPKCRSSLDLACPSPHPHSRPSSPDILMLQLPPEIMLLYKCLLHVMEDEEKYREMLKTRGKDAQELVDFFQKMLDRPEITGAPRRDILTALIQLSTASGLYPQCFTLKSDELEADRIPVASGHFGEVLKGTIQNQPVCVKVIKLYQKSQINTVLKVFLKEAVIWGQLQHPNLLPFYGVYHLDGTHSRLCLVSPWMENGTIVEYLRSHADANRLLLARDIAQGLNFLHDKNIVHGDLKGANILVTKAGRACLTDFGLSRLNDIEAIRFAMLESSGHRGGTPRWEAPELLDESDAVIHRTPASDVYAFGCVCYEIFTGKVPFFELPKDFMVYLKVSRGQRPTRPASGTWPVRRWGLTDGVWELITRCWAQSSADRPTISGVLRSLNLTGIRDSRPDERGILTPSAFRSALWDSAREGSHPTDKAIMNENK